MADRSGQLEDLRLVVPWFSPSKLIFIVFCLLWDLAAIQLLQEETVKGVLMLVPGILLSLLTLSWTLNHTVVRVKRGELSVRYAPIPWMGIHKIPTQEIVQLKIQPNLSGNPEGEVAASSYSLTAVMAGGQEVRLINSLDYRRARVLREKIRHRIDDFRQG